MGEFTPFPRKETGGENEATTTTTERNKMKKKLNVATDADRGRTAKTPNPAAEAWRRFQAEALLRRCGYVELPDGTWIDPTDPNDKGLRLG